MVPFCKVRVTFTFDLVTSRSTTFYFHIQALPSLAIVLLLMGFNMGAIDCLANVQMIQLYGDAVSPFLQVGEASLCMCNHACALPVRSVSLQ